MNASTRLALLLSACAMCAVAQAQDASRAMAVVCPTAAEVAQVHLLGVWQAEIEGFPQGATLSLEKHPEFAETFRGTVNRNGQRLELAGDVDEGELTLEESANGNSISATWLGDVVEGSCGREIRGRWQAEGEKVGHPFVLRKR